jgi:ribosomal protein S18 acetylase RimI-like enzyme
MRIRDATRADCAAIARLYQISSDGVALLPAFRGGGTGMRLMELAERKARESGASKLSLVVFEQNEAAVRLYIRLGFRETAREAVCPHPLIHFDGDALLMIKELTN